MNAGTPESQQYSLAFRCFFVFIAPLTQHNQFYSTIPIRHTMCAELSWSHYRLHMQIPDDNVRALCAEECAKSALAFPVY